MTLPALGTAAVPIEASIAISAKDAITRGTSNVFADLGYADATERQATARISVVAA